MDTYKEFNQSLKYFIRELIELFPNLVELKIALTMYKAAKTVSRKTPQQHFHNLIHPHSKELLSKNFGHIFSESFEDPYIKKLLQPFQQEFDNLDDDNKDMIWRHMVILYHKSLKCEGKIDIKVSLDITNNELQSTNIGCFGETSTEGTGKQGTV